MKSVRDSLLDGTYFQKPKLETVRKSSHCHEAIKEVAVGMAHEVYAQLMASNNKLYREWRESCPDATPKEAEATFVLQTWPHLVEEARATMAKMLHRRELSHLHDSIADALLKDNTLCHRRSVERGLH